MSGLDRVDGEAPLGYGEKRERGARARELRAQGYSYREIAAALDLSENGAWYWLRGRERVLDKYESRRRAAGKPTRQRLR